MDNCCQTELKLEELLTRYKKGKASWEQHANLLDIANGELNQENENLRDEIEQLLNYKNQWQETAEELIEQEDLLNSKNSTIAGLANQIKVLKNQFRQKEDIIQQQITALTQDKQNLQTQIDNHLCSLTCQESCCVNNDYDTIKHERDAYQTQLGTKDQKIAELETQLSEKEQQLKEKDRIIEELRNKPPLLNPTNNPDKSDNNHKSEPNNFFMKKTQLLSTIKQQKETIQELQTQLTQTNSPEPQIIFKEIPVENLEVIQQLKKELKVKKQTITQLHLIYLLLLGVSVLLLTYIARTIKKKNKPKN